MADEQTLIELTADLVAAHVSNNKVAIGDVATLVANVHTAFATLGAPAPEPAPEKKTPAVSVRASVKPDLITCLECGSKQKMLKRHLQTAHGLTPAEYRQQFGLPASYPMVAPDYAQQRSDLAKKIGLGFSRRGSKATTDAGTGASTEAAPSPDPALAEQPKRRRTLSFKTAAASGDTPAEAPKRRGRARAKQA